MKKRTQILYLTCATLGSLLLLTACSTLGFVDGVATFSRVSVAE